MSDIQVVPQVQKLPTAKLRANPWNRKVFSPEGLQDLILSIKAKGVLEPLIVRSQGDGYEICSGNRRWLAAQAAGLTEVPCYVQSMSDDDVQDMNLVTNIQNEEINPLEKAQMVKARMDSGHLTSDQMAELLGKGKNWVSDLLQILSLPVEVQQHLSDKPVSVDAMQALAKLPAGYQMQAAKEVKSGAVRPEHLENRVRQLMVGHKVSQTRAKARDKKREQNEADLQKWKEEQAQKADNGSPTATSGMTTRAASSLPAGRQAPPPASSAPVASSALATALKDDLADHYLFGFGRVGGVLRNGLDKVWGSGSGNKQGLFKWGLLFLLVSWLWHPVLKTINYCFTRLMHVEVNREINQNTVPPLSGMASAFGASPQKLTLDMLTPVPAPTGLKVEMLKGQMLHFTWNPVPGAIGYNFYSAHAWQDNLKQENQQINVPTEAYWHLDEGPDEFKFAITALDGKNHESVPSEAVHVDFRRPS